MKKFKFTLDTVHQVRERKSEQENLTLTELQFEAQEAQMRVSHIETMRQEAVERYMERLNSGVHLNPREMELSSNHFASLNSLQKEAQKVVEEKQDACRRQLEKVHAARVEVKVTDKLRDSQQRRHNEEVARREQNNIEELVTAKFARRIQGSK